MGRKLTKEEINAALAPRGIQMTGEYKNAKTKTKFYSTECGHEWEALPDHVKRGRGCAVCAGKRHTTESINAELKARRITMLAPYQGAHTLNRFQCERGHEWQATPASVKYGAGCPHCAGNAKASAESINATLATRGIELTGIYQGERVKAQFTGACGHVWETRPSNVLRGNGCPACAEYGMWRCETGYVYVMAYGDGLTKIGVSNEPARRLATLRRATREEIALIAVYQFGDGTGRAAAEAEQLAHRHFSDQREAPRQHEGGTELFRITPAEACDYLRRAGGRVAELEEATA